MFKLIKLSALVGIFAFVAHQAEAGQRYATPPPVTLSPDLTSTWTLQIKPKRRVATARDRARARRPKGLRRWKQNGYKPVRARRKTHVRVAAVPRRVKRVKQVSNHFPPELLPATVRWSGSEKPGTLIVNTIERRLYLITAPGKARRYAVGVGKPGFEWAGNHRVSRKAEWPDWRPPAEMIARERKKGRHLKAFYPGGRDNPMGARALYLGSSLYRIHGTNQNWSIGKAVSSGCIRMRNQDVMDLYERVPVGARVKVI